MSRAEKQRNLKRKQIIFCEYISECTVPEETGGAPARWSLWTGWRLDSPPSDHLNTISAHIKPVLPDPYSRDPGSGYGFRFLMTKILKFFYSWFIDRGTDSEGPISRAFSVNKKNLYTGPEMRISEVNNQEQQ